MEDKGSSCWAGSSVGPPGQLDTGSQGGSGHGESLQLRAASSNGLGEDRDAEVLAGELCHEAERARLQRYTGCEPGPGASIVEAGAKPGAPWEADERPVGQLGEANARLAGERVEVTDSRDESLVGDDLGGDPGRGWPGETDPGQVERPAHDPVEEVVGGGLRQRDLDTGMVPVKTGEQPGELNRGARGDHADSDAPADEPGELVEREPAIRDGAESGAGVGKQDSAGRSEPDGALRAVEEGLAELTL